MLVEEAVQMVRRTLVTVLLMLFVGVLTLGAQGLQGLDVSANRYFVGFKNLLAPDDDGFLRDQGVQLSRTFPEIQAVEVVIQNAEQLLAIGRDPRVEYV